MKRCYCSLLILCLALTTTAAFPQDKTDKTQAAEKAAADWLKLLDFDAYAKSWHQASTMLRIKVTEGNYEQTLRETRSPLGAVLSRAMKSIEYRTQLPGFPDAEYALLKYDTSFEHKKRAVETVTMTLEKDGHWRAAGYSIR
jgi:hypothetical protein